jgi:hypothetical protein
MKRIFSFALRGLVVLLVLAMLVLTVGGFRHLLDIYDSFSATEYILALALCYFTANVLVGIESTLK